MLAAKGSVTVGFQKAEKVFTKSKNTLRQNFKLSGQESNGDPGRSCSWYNGLTSYLKNRLQTPQNRVVRVILKLPMRTHLDPSHSEGLRWLKVQERVSSW